MKNIQIIIFSLFLFTTFINLICVEQVQDFRLENMKGKKASLSDFQKEGLVIIDFWATYCEPCKKALPELNEIHEKYDDVNVVTICVDKPRKKDRAKAFIKSKHYKFHVLFDPDRSLQKKLNVTSIPRTIIIDSDGKVLYDHKSYVSGDEKHYIEVIEKWRNSKKMKATPILKTEER